MNLIFEALEGLYPFIASKLLYLLPLDGQVTKDVQGVHREHVKNFEGAWHRGER